MTIESVTSNVSFLRVLRRRGVRFEVCPSGSLILHHRELNVCPDEMRRVAQIRDDAYAAGESWAWDRSPANPPINPYMRCGFPWLRDAWEAGYTRGREAVTEELSRFEPGELRGPET